MTVDGALDLFRQALYVAMQTAGPLLLAALVVGLVVGVLQTATQINEGSIVFVLKLLGVVVVLFAMGPDIIGQLVEYIRRSFGAIASIVR